MKTDTSDYDMIDKGTYALKEVIVWIGKKMKLSERLWCHLKKPYLVPELNYEEITKG